ncbi:MAG: hypothetical protein PHR06_05095 [Candidatus Cloacimonetes bacterium]|nr:hypothetical protein [Candidatus Cloacimonadota bacterium]
MRLKDLINTTLNKENFTMITNYMDFCEKYLYFIKSNLQAVIVSKNENNYQFFQYKKDGTYNVTRPINNNLMVSLGEFDKAKEFFFSTLKELKKEKKELKHIDGMLINHLIYTCQQTIGATLDALPATKSNFARKMNGDLFERFILLILQELGFDVSSGNIAVPVSIKGKELFKMKYQHDLIIKIDEETKAIGSVKTSSKDRIDKIFIDKFLYNKLTEKNTPHFAIFLNDVQRKGQDGKYRVNTTFLPGHFKGYIVKLNPLDGVYYFDIRPNMLTEDILKDCIKMFDRFILEDIWMYKK